MFVGTNVSSHVLTVTSLYTVVFRGFRLRLKCDGTRAETRFRLSAKRTSPFKSAGASVQSTTDSRGLRISGSNAGYTKFRGSVKSTGYPLHSPVSPSLHLPCVTVCHHISTGLYKKQLRGSVPTFRRGTLLHVRFHFLTAWVADMGLWVHMNLEGHHWIMPKFGFAVDLIPSTM
jgi:hypothetical protein